MGQTNANSLREAELTKVYTIDSKDSENSLTYLTHRQSQLSYLLREMTYSSEIEAQEMAAKIEQRRQFRSGNITNLISSGPTIQERSSSRKIICAPSTRRSTPSGTTPRTPSLTTSTCAPCRRLPSPPTNSEV